jgi:hypothetical protein
MPDGFSQRRRSTDQPNRIISSNEGLGNVHSETQTPVPASELASAFRNFCSHFGDAEIFKKTGAAFIALWIEF